MRRNLLFLLLTFIFLLACQISEEKRIHQILNRREEALKKRNLSLYLSCISRAYQDKEEDFNRLQSRIGGYFKTFDRIEFNHWDRSIHIEGETARATQQFYLEVERRGKKHSYSGKEALFLGREEREWKIIKGL